MVKRLFLIVYPPFGESSILGIDVRIGIVTVEEPSILVTIGTSLEDICHLSSVRRQHPHLVTSM